ncbi:MAG: cob(I)yrinic acid a,c-diamide adenosyltransferase [Bacteroidetes bacterium]|nr:cob(I)yrinic acid a,c-diamide adenosyltransferase [Bacteroidota bacterium]MBS1539367.1 cob(I)yrinic acid a,c-diamide adenosyltransferase [Bacteroidota bacterium]
MKIYTKTGDQGTTALFGGKRLPKSDLRIDAYGTVDELNSFLGLVRDQPINTGRKEILTEIQDRLFTIGSILATDPANTKVKIPSLAEDDIKFLENEIDKMDAALPAMKHFVLPGGHASVSITHVTRTVCRRAERLVVALAHSVPVDPLVIKYLNRLSDFLFVLSRLMAQELNITESPWLPKM